MKHQNSQDIHSPLTFTNFTKRYGKARGVEDINLEVKHGETFGFLGPNGAGKTTTIRTILNFMKPSSGTIALFGLDSVKDSIKVKQKIGYLAGDYELFENLTGAQYLELVANLHGLKDRKSTVELTERLSVTLHQKIRTLSRGNKQKIGLVAALLHDPDLLILDEPTSGLDPIMQNQFYELMKERKQRGKSVFISSHILSEVQEVCDRVSFMRSGKLIETVNVAQLIQEARKQITLVFQPGTKPMHLPNFDSLEIVHKNAKQLTFTTKAPVKDVLKWLSMQPVEDVTIQNTSLDEVFLKLYGDGLGAEHV